MNDKELIKLSKHLRRLIDSSAKCKSDQGYLADIAIVRSVIAEEYTTRRGWKLTAEGIEGTTTHFMDGQGRPVATAVATDRDRGPDDPALLEEIAPVASWWPEYRHLFVYRVQQEAHG